MRGASGAAYYSGTYTGRSWLLSSLLAGRSCWRASLHCREPSHPHVPRRAYSSKKARRFRRTFGIGIDINWGTNELSFADYAGAVNISGDRLAFVETNA